MKKLIQAAIVAAVVTTGTVIPVAAVEAAPASYAGGCHWAVDMYWPAQHRAWAHQIVQRESRGIPTAANRRSSARGCFQMLLRYSAPFYQAVGCTNAQWSNPVCNVRAAYVMFQRAGKSPWRV